MNTPIKRAQSQNHLSLAEREDCRLAINTLNLKNINLHSPYMVGQIDENDSTFYLRKDNPRLKELLAEFEETISIVFD